MARFVPGISGNPGGRPKVAGELRELARQHTAEAFGVLLEVMRNQKAPAPARIAAALAVLDRGHGKPVQAHQIEADVAMAADTGEARRIIANEIERIRANMRAGELDRAELE